MKNLFIIFLLLPIFSFSKRDTIFVDSPNDARFLAYRDSMNTWTIVSRNQKKYVKAVTSSPIVQPIVEKPKPIVQGKVNAVNKNAIVYKKPVQVVCINPKPITAKIIKIESAQKKVEHKIEQPLLVQPSNAIFLKQDYDWGSMYFMCSRDWDGWSGWGVISALTYYAAVSNGEQYKEFTYK